MIKNGQRVYVGYSLYRVMAKNGVGDLFLLPITESGLRDKERGPLMATEQEVSPTRKPQIQTETEPAL